MTGERPKRANILRELAARLLANAGEVPDIELRAKMVRAAAELADAAGTMELERTAAG